MEPRELSLAAACEAMARGELAAAELVGSVLRQIERYDPAVNAFITVRPLDELLREGERIDQRRSRGQRLGPLAGIPVALKDNFATEGLRTTAGSRILSDWVPGRDAAAVRRLKEADAVVVGKLNLHEFADGPTNDNPHYGRTENPWAVGRTPGGSSGGAGAALAADMCLAALGTDTGGSIRTPAAFCGVVGLKPTYGLVSRAGVVPFSWTLDHAGPMTREVRDIGLLLRVIAGHDPEDPGSAPGPPGDPLDGIERGLDGLVVGTDTGYFQQMMEPGVRRVLDRAARRIVELGGDVRAVQLPTMRAALPAELAILFPEAASAHHQHLERHLDEYGEDVRRSLLSGRLYRGVDYVNAQRVRARIRRELAEAFRQVDLLLTPTVILEPPVWGQETFQVEGRQLDPLNGLIRCLAPFNLSGNPALSVPYGYGDRGLPVGVQLVGPHFAEPLLLRAGRALEEDFAPQRRKPPLELLSAPGAASPRPH